MEPKVDTPAETANGTVDVPVDTRTDAAISTENRLLDTAERMFGEQGVEAVSIRTITTAAEANVAAAHYYFRSKEGLVRAIFTRRMGEISDRRSELLGALEARDAVTAHDIAAAVVVPLAELVTAPDDERRHYLGFLASTMATRGPLRALALESFDPQLHRFDELLADALPDVPRPVRLSRFMIIVDAAIRQLADLKWASLPWTGTGGSVEPEELVCHLIEALTGTLIGPEPRSRSGKSGASTSRRTEGVTAVGARA